MSSISGITFERDKTTQQRYLCINLEQHGETIIPFLIQVGVIPPDDDFEKTYATAITGNEMKKRMYKRIDDWQWKEK